MIKHLHTILTQDNHCTAEPCFLVFGHKKIFIDPDFAENGEAVYVENQTGDYLEMSDKEYIELEDRLLDAFTKYRLGEKSKLEIPIDHVLDGPFDPDNWERRAYFWEKEFNQVFFTEAAAKEYIEANSHRIPGSRDGQKPVIFIESFYRNPEMIAVRKMLLDKARVECDNTTH